MRLGFVSAAHIHAQSYLAGLRQAPDGRVVHAVWDDVPQRGARHAALAGARFEPEFDRLAGDPAIDGFVVCAENTRHLALLKKLLPTGKPIMCEKPLTTTAAEARELAALVHDADARIVTGYFLPFSAELQSVAGMLGRGEFGAVTGFRIRNSHGGAYARIFDSDDLRWFTQPALSGGGAFMDVGAHAIHLARTLFGPVREVWADIGNHTGIYPACDDAGIAHLRFESGVVGTIEASWIETGGENGLEINGSIRSLWKVGRNYVSGCHGRSEPMPLTPASSRPAQIDRLAALFRNELSPLELKSDFAAAIDAVAIMAACYRSAAGRQWVTVAECTAAR